MKILTRPLIICVFVIVILADWYYAYTVQYLPDIIINSWSVMFPFISLLYFVFSAVGCGGLYNKSPWGLRLASFMIMFGAMMGALSFGLAYREYPDVEQMYVMLLIFNFLALVYLEIYYYCRKK